MNQTVTENGANSFVSTLDHRLNLFFKTTRDVGVLPGEEGKKYKNEDGIEVEPMDNQILYDMIDDSWRVNPLDTMKILMNWRDCRGGKGDHRGFIVAMTYIEDKYSDWFYENIDIIPEYGCWLDLVKLWHFVSDTGKNVIMKTIVTQLKQDHDKLSVEDRSVSLLAKWLPSENSKWDRYTKKRFVIAICKELYGARVVTGDHIRSLRTCFLVPLRKRLSILETKLCIKDYDNIKYDTVPSVAMHKYRKAFIRNDKERFEEYLDLVKSGVKKINASQVYPHDLVRQYLSHGKAEDPVIEAQWNDIKTKVRASGVFNDSIVVCDVSGSMSGTPMEVAIALGLLGLCNNKLITFSEHPTLHHVPDGSLYSQVANVRRMEWGCNTNFEKVFDLVIGMCSMGTHIKRVYVYSDMQFDQAFCGGDMTHFQILKQKFEDFGLSIPQIVFWNLRGDTKDFPVTCDERGVVMMSGYSPSLLSSIVDGDDISPLTMLLKIINSPRYDMVKQPLLT